MKSEVVTRPTCTTAISNERIGINHELRVQQWSMDNDRLILMGSCLKTMLGLVSFIVDLEYVTLALKGSLAIPKQAYIAA